MLVASGMVVAQLAQLPLSSPNSLLNELSKPAEAQFAAVSIQTATCWALASGWPAWASASAGLRGCGPNNSSDTHVDRGRDAYTWIKSPGHKLVYGDQCHFSHDIHTSEKMEKLLDGMEDIAGRILQFLQQNTAKKSIHENDEMLEQLGEFPATSICYLHKHKGCIKGDEEYMNNLKYDVIRMLIKGSEFPHALCLHVSNGCSEFHVYSKKGWVSFQPEKDSLIVTIGDLLQTWSGGQYKHVIGRAVFQGQTEDCVSMASLISPPKITEDSTKHEKEKTLSIGQQIIIAIAFVLIYNLFINIFKKF